MDREIDRYLFHVFCNRVFAYELFTFGPVVDVGCSDEWILKVLFVNFKCRFRSVVFIKTQCNYKNYYHEYNLEVGNKGKRVVVRKALN